jgi:hypothetical protein
VTLKIIDIKNVTTLVKEATSSSSTSCNSPDFPVLRGGERKDINFNDLSWISVLHDRPANDDNIYINVELTLKNGKTEVHEMIKSIRFTGKSDQGDFSIQVKDISTVQVLDK